MTIYAYTENHAGYPAYVNLTENNDGTVKISVRSRGEGGKNHGSIELTVEQAQALATAINRYANTPDLPQGGA